MELVVFVGSVLGGLGLFLFVISMMMDGLKLVVGNVLC